MATQPFDMPLPGWAYRSTLAVTPDADGAAQARWDILVRRLNGISGVVPVTNDDRHPLSLKGYRHRGRTVPVVTGALELEDAKLEDPHQNLLTVIAYGDLAASGTIEAALILTHTPEVSDAHRAFRGTAEVEGALLVTHGGFSGDVRLRWRPDRLAGTDPRTGTVLADWVHVSISPNLRHSSVVDR